MTMKSRIALMSLAVGALLVSACAGGPTSTIGDAGGTTDQPGLETVTIGMVPTISMGWVYLGKERGFFADEGIDVEIDSSQSGAAITTGVLEGSYDLGFSGSLPPLIAVSKGAPLKFVIGNSVIPANAGPETVTALVTTDASGISSYEDLPGKTIAVNSLRGGTDLCVRAALEKSGLDPASVKMIELPFPQMAPSLEQGQVDAAVVIEPFRTPALDAGLRSGGDPCVYGLPPNSIYSLFLSSEQTLREKGDLLARVRNAMTKAQEYANAHPDEVKEQVVKYTEVPADVVSKIYFEPLQPNLDEQAYDQLLDLMVKHDFIPSKDSVEGFLS